MAKLTKTLLVTLILAISMFQSVESNWYIYMRLHTCYHYRHCISTANQIWLTYGRRMPRFYRPIYATILSRMLRYKLRNYLIPIHNTMNQFFPLFGFNKYPPTPWYRAKYGRRLEAVKFDQEAALADLQSGRMLEEEVKDKSIMKDEIKKMTSLDELKSNLCKAVSNDSEVYKGSYEMVKSWYQFHARYKVYKETNELRPLAYFDLSCMVNPHNELVNDTQQLSMIEKIALEEDINFSLEFLVGIYDLAEASHEEELQNVQEMADDGSRWDSTASTENFPTTVVGEDGYISDKELLAISENAF